MNQNWLWPPLPRQKLKKKTCMVSKLSLHKSLSGCSFRGRFNTGPLANGQQKLLWASEKKCYWPGLASDFFKVPCHCLCSGPVSFRGYWPGWSSNFLCLRLSLSFLVEPLQKVPGLAAEFSKAAWREMWNSTASLTSAWNVSNNKWLFLGRARL